VAQTAFVYILRCADGRLHVGHTRDVAARERRHNDGKGSAFTAARRPVRVAYTEAHSSDMQAIERERQLKRWSLAKKESLVSGDLRVLRRLSRRRIR
jgi:predicted GIY-YIG superfamily endonuclease